MDEKKVDAIECDLEPKNNEGRLRKDLFCNYDRDNRPTLSDGPITIRIKMIVKGFNFADDQGTLTVATWLAMVRFSVCACTRVYVYFCVFENNRPKKCFLNPFQSWTDEHLKWDKTKYNNLATITQSSETIWQPDMALYNRYTLATDFKLHDHLKL